MLAAEDPKIHVSNAGKGGRGGAYAWRGPVGLMF